MPQKPANKTLLLAEHSSLLCLQALEQATFRLPDDLRSALVQCSVSLPTPLAYLAVEFDNYGWGVIQLLSEQPHITAVVHPAGHQLLLETACSGLTLAQALPHFAHVVERFVLAC